MPIYNFKCSCGNTKNDQYFSLNTLPQSLGCSCGGQMEQDYSDHKVGYSASGYPKFDIQTGMTYLSKEDKDRKLREAGLQEADWKSGGMKLSETHKHEGWKNEKTQASRQEAVANNDSEWGNEEELVREAKM